MFAMRRAAHKARGRAAIPLLGIIAILLAACGGSAPTHPGASSAPSSGAGQPVKGGTLRVGIVYTPSSLDPIRATNASDQNNLYPIYDTLVDLDPGLTPRPGLAESWQASPDLKTYTFKLRKGVKFQDGTDFNAAAVKFQIDRIKNPATKATVALPEVQSVDVVDDYTVRFNLKTPSVSLPASLADKAGMIASPAAVQKYGEDFGRHPVGAGPFKLVEWLADDHVYMERFDGYWEKGLPYLDRLEFKVIPDASVLLTNLRAGSLDFMNNVSAADASRMQQNADVKIMMAPVGNALRMLRFVSVRPPFNNVALRQAVAYAIDREALAKGVLFGLAKPADGIVLPTSWGYDPNVHPYKRDLAKAKEKLAEGGKPAGFSFECNVINDPDNVKFATAIKAQLAEVGIQMDIKPMTLAEMGARGSSKDLAWTAMIGRWAGLNALEDGFTQVHYSTGSGNNGRYGPASKKIDPLIDKAKGTADPATRKELYKQVQTIINDEALDVPLVFDNTTVAMSPKVQNYQMWGNGYMHFKEVWLQK